MRRYALYYLFLYILLGLSTVAACAEAFLIVSVVHKVFVSWISSKEAAIRVTSSVAAVFIASLLFGKLRSLFPEISGLLLRTKYIILGNAPFDASAPIFRLKLTVYIIPFILWVSVLYRSFHHNAEPKWWRLKEEDFR